MDIIFIKTEDRWFKTYSSLISNFKQSIIFNMGEVILNINDNIKIACKNGIGKRFKPKKKDLVALLYASALVHMAELCFARSL